MPPTLWRAVLMFRSLRSCRCTCAPAHPTQEEAQDCSWILLNILGGATVGSAEPIQSPDITGDALSSVAQQ